MGRSKKPKSGGGGGGMSKKQADGSRGERLRRRAGERAMKRAAKRRKAGKTPLLTKKIFTGHEGRVTKHVNKRRLELARLERLVAKQEELLHDYRPPKHVELLDPELKRKRRRRDFYDLDTSHWKLTGAARPADFLPGAGGTELVNERDPWEAGEDLFEKLGGRDGAPGSFYEGPEACREYLDLNHQLAQALHNDGSRKETQTRDAVSRYQRCLALDPADHIMARRGLVRLLMDAGEADQARVLIDRFPDDRGCEMAWSLAAIEYVAWSVLEEEGSGQEVAEAALAAAYEANPFVAWYIGHRKIFDEVVEHADEIDTFEAATVEEAFWYMAREGGLWESLEGSSDWVGDFLLRNSMLPPDPKASGGGRSATDCKANGSVNDKKSSVEGEDGDGGSSEECWGMFASMFETAVGMAAEAAQERLSLPAAGEEGVDSVGDDGGGDTDGDGDVDDGYESPEEVEGGDVP